MLTAIASPKGFNALRAYAIEYKPNLDLNADAQAAEVLQFQGLLLIATDCADPACEAAARRATLIKLVQAASVNNLDAYLEVCLDLISTSAEQDHAPPSDGFRPVPPAKGAVHPRNPMADVDLLALRRPQNSDLQAWWWRRLDGLQALGVSRFTYRGASAAADILAGELRAQGYPIERLDHVGDQPQSVSAAVLVSQAGPASSDDPEQAYAVLAAAAIAAPGWAMAAGVETGVEQAVANINRLMAEQIGAPQVRALSGSGSAIRLALSPRARGDLIFARNTSSARQPWPPTGPLVFEVGRLKPVPGFTPSEAWIEPGQTLLFEAAASAAVTIDIAETAIQAADRAQRIVISKISPSVDDGAFCVKRVVGDTISVESKIFTDGHTPLAAALLVKAEDEVDWSSMPMIAGHNDLWTAETSLPRLGRHSFKIEAWVDVWGGFTSDFQKKRDAGLDVSLELREARALIEAAKKRAIKPIATALSAILKQWTPADPATQAQLLLSPELDRAMAKADDRPFLTSSFEQPIEVDRVAARYASWYELFPRSQTSDAARHGTFADVTARLPQIAAMGFDTLYLPPIHPIGEKNRKGRNNSLTPDPTDVGSPWAVGGEDGGHDAVHPQLGTLEDFRQLLAAAQRLGLEIAIDFAIQCAPDHPWIKAHPEWFDWRPDGSIKYAENPPKKYQDIVNVDFYREGAVPALWETLRDVVLFWVAQGVKTFRVDNPHTKPMPFWRWMIAQVKARHPDTIFLAEAFARPATMYQLAKLGFCQSYTYFTWRNTKAELTEYLTELTQTPPKDFYRPHFFVNTPDINPVFLQTSGRAGFLIRAALAATLSGLFGVYAGFELCEAAPLPGREEYLDSEKYEIRPRPHRAPGDIVDEITQLNALRRAEPALQNHLGVLFETVFNDNILYYAKSAPGETGLLLIAVSLDPHHAQEADFELPLWRLSLADNATVAVEDLLTRRRMRWSGKRQHMRLTPTEPYAIWRLAPLQDA